MNFGETIKKEIISKPIKELHCKKAFLAGIIRGSGVLFDNNGEIALSFKLNKEETAYLVSNLIESIFDYSVREFSVYEDKLNKKDVFEIVITGEKTVEILKDLEILLSSDSDYIVNFNFYGKLTEKECCFRSFLRGLFVTSGVCLVPEFSEGKRNTKYHFEIVFSHSEPAVATSGKLLNHKIVPKILRRKDSFVLYLKSAESIKDFLAFIQVPVSVLKLTDLIINRELINDTNRRMNCDLGNVNKQVEASQKQIDAIKLIDEKIKLSSLDDKLKKVCEARLNNPEETLLELAERLGISKSCLNHRLRKIIEISNELKGSKND